MIMKFLYAICGATFGLTIIWLLLYVVIEAYITWNGGRTVLGAFTIPVMFFLPAGIITGAKLGSIYRDTHSLE